jgi:hypothetical protein
MLGFAGIGAVMALGACSGEDEMAAAAPPPVPAAAQCQSMPGVYAQVVEARPVFFNGEFDPGFIAVTDTSMIESGGQPNAVRYTVVTNDGRQMPLVAREQFRQGDQLYIETDTCDRARVTVIQELG